MKLIITCDLDPGDQDIGEIRRRLAGHAEVVRHIIRYGGMSSGVGLESFVLAKSTENRNPRIRRVDVRVEP